MLHEFLTSNRKELITRCRDKAGKRFEPAAPTSSIDHGVPLFLQQLVEILRIEQLTDKRESDDESGSAKRSSPTEIGRSAALHGTELLRLGFSVDQVVHGYGDVCQSVTELAVEEKEPISADEFRTLNRCLDNAIADAVTAYGKSTQTSLNAQAVTLAERMEAFAAEQQRLVDIADQAYSAIKSGNIGLTGATGTLLVHTLSELRSLPERTLPEIRLPKASAKTPAK
jgi:hypothetical protein